MSTPNPGIDWKKVMGGGMDWLRDFGIGQSSDTMSDSYQKMLDMYDKYYKEGSGNLKPYIDAGHRSIPNMEELSSRLGKESEEFNPNQSLEDMMAGYKESDYAKYLKKNALEAANNSSEMSGLLGSGQNISDNARISDEISSKDIQQYLTNLMEQQQYGLQKNTQYSDVLSKLFGGGLEGSGKMNDLMSSLAKGQSDAMAGKGASDAAGGQSGTNQVADLAKIVSMFMGL